jgi:hypothetical protein
MDRPGTSRRLIAARLRVLVLVAPLLALEFVALNARQGPQFLLGLAVWYGVVALSTVITMAVAAGLRARLVWLAVGIGPRLGSRVVGNRLQTIRALPLSISARFVPADRNFGRDFRIISATGLLCSTGLGAVAVLALPGYGAAAVGLTTIAMIGLTLTVRDPDSGRYFGARVFLTPSLHNDPALAGRDVGVAAQARTHVQFGDLAEADAILATLRTDPAAARSAALVTAELLAARGDYDAALRVHFPDADPGETPALGRARRASDSARIAKLLLLAAERDPSLAPKAVPLAERHLRAIGTATTTDRTARALYALHGGDLRSAARANRICAARAIMPLAAAEALCDQARLEALRGNPAKAARVLARAARLAPWYPRIAVVRQIAGAEAAAAITALPVAEPTPNTAQLFTEPWSVPTPDEG